MPKYSEDRPTVLGKKNSELSGESVRGSLPHEDILNPEVQRNDFNYYYYYYYYCETGFSTKFQNSQFPKRIIQTRYHITLQTSLAKMHNCQKPKILYPLYSTRNQLHMKLQPTAHETLQLSVNSQQVTKGLFTSPSPSPATN